MELPNARLKFAKVRQRGTAWCIPAGLEVLLSYFDITTPTQEDMILQYDKKFGGSGYYDLSKAVLKDGYLVEPPKVHLQNPTAEQLKEYGFPRGDFVAFEPIVNSQLPKDCARIFDHPSDRQEKFEYYLEQTLTSEDGMLGVVTHPDGSCHVLAIVDYNGKYVTAYDPGSGKIEIKAVCEFNRDCIIFKKTPKTP